MAEVKLLFCFLLLTLFSCLLASNDILCEQGFCRSYRYDEGCAEPAIHCSINNATHTGLSLPSPTLCNCCEYCLPFFGADEHCTTGGPGTGTTVGRCGDGLFCTTDDTGWSSCTRMESKCHTAQDEYDERERRGLIGSLEQRPHCDGKGKFATFECIPAHTCFCQSEDGERLFGEVRNLGDITTRNMLCGCSRFHDRIRKSIAPAVPFPVTGPRCTPDGSFYPIQCISNKCYCVNILTGIVEDERNVDLTRRSIKELPCYDEETDLYPEYSEGDQLPYNFTTPCLEEANERTELIIKSAEAGYIVDFFSTFIECLPDGTYGFMRSTRDGRKICIDDRGRHIENYGAEPGTAEYENMDCKCARTTYVMGDVPEKPICCSNGNFRRIQCRRGLCRCVDSDGRQDPAKEELADVTKLDCYKPDWKTC